MSTASFIWYKKDGSTDLINLEREGDQTIVIHEFGGGVIFDQEIPESHALTQPNEYRKHRSKWGNYLLPASWELRVYKNQWSGNWEYKDVYDVMVMDLTSKAEADGVKLIGHNVDRIDNDPETMTSTYLAEAIGYVK